MRERTPTHLQKAAKALEKHAPPNYFRSWNNQQLAHHHTDYSYITLAPCFIMPHLISSTREHAHEVLNKQDRPRKYLNSAKKETLKRNNRLHFRSNKRLYHTAILSYHAVNFTRKEEHRHANYAYLAQAIRTGALTPNSRAYQFIHT